MTIVLREFISNVIHPEVLEKRLKIPHPNGRIEIEGIDTSKDSVAYTVNNGSVTHHTTYLSSLGIVRFPLTKNGVRYFTPKSYD